MGASMTGPTIGRISLAMTLGLGLAGCQADQPFAFLKAKPAAAGTAAASTAAPADASSVKLVDRDVEAPDIYHAKAKALWDGRPSLGGVWIAAVNVKEPQRVIIRNPKNGKFVIGALFHREQGAPGPKLQLSSDAAEALGMLAGQPATVDVTALKRVEQPAPAPKTNPKEPALSSNEAIKTKPIADIRASAAAAIDKAAARTTAKSTAKTAMNATAKSAAAEARVKPVPRPKAAPASTTHTAAATHTPAATHAAKPKQALLGRDYVQIGIFAVEANAQRASRLMQSKHVPVAVLKEESHGKTYSRVLVGPVTSANRDKMLAKMKSLGFEDAYVVER